MVRSQLMRSPIFAGLVAAAVVVLAPTVPAGEHAAHKSGEPPHWSYDGAEGPEHWGDLDPAFAACKLGHRQSPIDIPAAKIKAVLLPAIRFDYKATPLRVTDNGHTVLAKYAPGSVIHVGEAKYELQQLHFHHPSEEHIDGKSFAMDAHLVHRDQDGRLAVVAILFQEGAPNPALAAVFGHLPAGPGKEATAVGTEIDASKLLPAKHAYFTFDGSLTTPPCTEGVTWYVLRVPVTASAEQLAAFAQRYPNDARPVQPIGDREIRASQ